MVLFFWLTKVLKAFNLAKYRLNISLNDIICSFGYFELPLRSQGPVV